MTLTDIGAEPPVTRTGLKRTARTTGVLYLCFFLTGIAGTLVVHPRLFAADDPLSTLSNLRDNESVAQLRVVLELGIVLTQALTAVWFFRLFHKIDALAAGALTAFGMANAIAMMGSAAVLATALDVADDASLAVIGGEAATVQLLYVASGHLWGVGAIFFGLWLIPMGRLVIRSGWLPELLGRVLAAGGIAYVLGAFVSYAFPDADTVTNLLYIPSIIGEFWIMGYLIIFGIREGTAPVAKADRPQSPPAP